MRDKHHIFWILLLSLIFFIYIQAVVQQGLFFDGLIYSTLANNISQGIGTVYDPRISKFYFQHFYEHPTLAIYLESIFFKVLGSSYYVERVYSLSIFLLVLTLIVKFWKTIYSESNENQKFSWLVVLLFLPLPMVFWVFTQNMLEGTLTMFSLASTYLLYKAMIHKDFKIQVCLIMIASLLIVAAFFSKGPVGVFPLVTIFIYYLATKKIRLQQSMILTLLLFLSVSIVFFLLMQDESLYLSTKHYLNQQVIASLQGLRPTVTNRLSIVMDLLKVIIPITLLSIIVFLFTRKKVQQDKEKQKVGIFFILVGLSASLPIVLSTKQYGFYLVPSLPYFSLGISIIIFPYVKYLFYKIKKPIYLIGFVYTLLLVSVLFTGFKINTYSRDQVLLTDLQCIAKEIGKDRIIHIDRNMSRDIQLNTYFMRYYNIELDSKNEYKYYLRYKKSNKFNVKLEEYDQVDIELKIYTLYIFK